MAHTTHPDPGLRFPFVSPTATHQTNEGRPAAPSTKEGVESFGTNTGPGAGVSEETRWSAANLDAVGAIMATQETFRKQLADMRENFNRVSDDRRYITTPRDCANLDAEGILFSVTRVLTNGMLLTSLKNIGLERETLKISARFDDVLAGKEQVSTVLPVRAEVGSFLRAQ